MYDETESVSMTMIRGQISRVDPDIRDRQISINVRNSVIQRDGGIDWRTGEMIVPDPSVCDVDHLIPRSMGGSSEADNLAVSSVSNNRSRGNSMEPIIEAGIGAVRNAEGYWVPDPRTMVTRGQEPRRYPIIRNPNHYDIGYAVEDAAEEAIGTVGSEMAQDIRNSTGYDSVTEWAVRWIYRRATPWGRADRRNERYRSINFIRDLRIPQEVLVLAASR